MDLAADRQFACEACGKRHRWSSQFAGKLARCSCGTEIVVPREDELDDEYELAEEILPARKAPGAPIHRAAPSEGGEGVAHSVSTARVLGYRRPGAVDETGGSEIDPVRDYYAPLGLIAGGLIVLLTFHAIFSSTGTFIAHVQSLMMHMLLGTFCLLLVVIIAAKIGGFSLGRFPLVLLKLCAISIAPDAITLLIAPVFIILPGVGGLILMVIRFALSFALIGALFNLEQDETWTIVKTGFVGGLIFLLIRVWTGF